MTNCISVRFQPERLGVALPPRLQKEIDELRDTYAITIVEQGDCINLIFAKFPLGEGYSCANSDLLVRIPRIYPDAGPDMFWLERNVLLANGQEAQNSQSIESYATREWRRFSWHRSAWNPTVDNLHGYLEFIRRRLKEKK
jgi:hypothetical protein